MNAEQRVLIIDSDLTLRISMYPVNQGYNTLIF